MKRMLYNLCRSLVAALVVGAVFASCNNEDDPAIQKNPLSKPVLKTSGLSDNGFSVEWAKVDNAAVYAYLVQGKGVSADAEWKYTLAQSVKFMDLEAGSEYTVQVKAVPDATSEFGDSPATEIKVSTEGQAAEFAEFVRNSLTPSGISLSVTPANQEQVYFIVNASKGALAQATSTRAFLRDFLERNFWFVDWSNPDKFIEDDYEALKRGMYVFNDMVNLRPERGYTFIACSVNNKGEILSYSTYTYETPAVEMVDCTFEIRIENVSYTSLDYEIIPSDLTTTYCFEVAEVGKYQGKTNDEIAQMLVSAQNYLLNANIHKTKQVYLNSGTRYGIYVVGSSSQLATTPLFVGEFETTVPDFTNLTNSSSKITEFKLGPIKQGTEEWSKGYCTLWVKTVPNAETDMYQVKVIPKAEADAKGDAWVAEQVYRTSDRDEFHQAHDWGWALTELIPVNTPCYVAVLSRAKYTFNFTLDKFEILTTPGNGQFEPDEGDGGAGGDDDSEV